MKSLRALPMLLAAALAARAAAGAPSLPAPEHVAAVASCDALDVTWDGVPGAAAYAIEITLVYDAGSDDCGSGTGTSYVLAFTVETTNVSIDWPTLVFDFGSGLRAPCRVSLVRVGAAGGEGPENPSQSAVPVPGCSPAPPRPPAPRA